MNPIKTHLCSPINLPLLPFSGEVPLIEQSTELEVGAVSIAWPGCNMLGGQVGTHTCAALTHGVTAYWMQCPRELPCSQPAAFLNDVFWKTNFRAFNLYCKSPKWKSDKWRVQNYSWLFDMLCTKQMPTYAQHGCLHVRMCMYVLTRPHKRKRHFMCILSKVLVCNRHMVWAVR